MPEKEKYQTFEFPISRLATVDIGAIGFSRHHMVALVEFDVTDARQRLAESGNKGEKRSFTAWLIRCIGQAVSEHRLLHGIRKGRRKVVVFDHVDISLMVEREINGNKVPLPLIIRRTEEKSIGEIFLEISGGKVEPLSEKSDYVLGRNKKRPLTKIYYYLPGYLRRLFWKMLIANPKLTKKMMGTVMVTSVGMVGNFHGWVIPVSVHPLCFAVGSIVKKPGVIGNDIKIRDYLYLTVLADHDVIDGAPAVRALARLKELVESGVGLN